MIPVLDKNAVRVITQQMDPEHAEYVAGISDIINNVQKNYPEMAEKDQVDDVIFISKIMAFADKFKNLHWAAKNHEYHKVLDDFGNELEEYKDDIAENIQSIIGQFSGNEFVKLELPINNNPLEVINELKMCVNNWLQLHNDDIEYEGCRNATSGFLQIVHKYIYLFRLCKINEA